MNDASHYIAITPTTHRPTRIDAILAARMKRLVRLRRRQLKRHTKAGRI